MKKKTKKTTTARRGRSWQGVTVPDDIRDEVITLISNKATTYKNVTKAMGYKNWKTTSVAHVRNILSKGHKTSPNKLKKLIEYIGELNNKPAARTLRGARAKTKQMNMSGSLSLAEVIINSNLEKNKKLKMLDILIDE